MINRVEDDFRLASDAQLRWKERCRGWMQKWENRVNPAGAGNEKKPNHTVPLIQWQCFNKWARSAQSMLGDEAEITAKPVGPSDAKKVHKMGRWMTSRVFDQMSITNPLMVFLFRQILFGHSVAYRPWHQSWFETKVNGKRQMVCDYEGPGFFPLEPDDFITPPERGITDLQKFSFVGRRVYWTIDELQRGDGKMFQGTSDPMFVEKLIRHAQDKNSQLLEQMVKDERERSEGVDFDTVMPGARTVEGWEWYGGWRPLKKTKASGSDPDEADLKARSQFEADWVVRYIPGMKEVVGVQDLVDIYPKMRRRRPFVESTLIKDGSYRGKGFGALLEDLEDEGTSISRLLQKAGEVSVSPIVFARPAAGAQLQQTNTLEPGTVYWTDDPSSIQVVTLHSDIQGLLLRNNENLAISERLTSINDQSIGRSMDKPTDPKTATGSLALIEQGNIRAWLDSTVLKEDMKLIVQDFYDLDCDMLPQTDTGAFFRVTEEQAKGLFDVREGGAFMTAKEFGGRYDFDLRFAPSVWAREARKQNKLAFFQVAASTPIVAMNPLAQWSLLNDIAKEFEIDFATIVPRPPELDMPKTPDAEWSMMLEGEYPEVNPQDHDELHIAEHEKQIDMERKNPSRDEQAIGYGIKHLMAHKSQMQEKKLMMALTQNIAQGLQEDPGNPVSQGIEQGLQEQELSDPAANGDNPALTGAVQPPLGPGMQGPAQL